MLAFIRDLFGRPGQVAGPTVVAAARAHAGDEGDETSGRHHHRSFAKMCARSMALPKEDGKYPAFEPRSPHRRLLGCGPTLNVDGTPMVGDTGFDERGRPYGVIDPRD
jgi:hypothetical protein